MKSRWVVGVVLAALLFSTAAPAVAAEGDKIVRTKALNGLPVVSSLCELVGCVVLGSLDTLPDQPTQPSSLFLVRGLVDNTLTLLLSLLGLAAVEPDVTVPLIPAGDWGANQASAAVLDQDTTPVTYYGTTAWRSYLRQPAAKIVRLADAHCNLGATGAGVVAVIDTGVDPDHPTLKPVLVKGYDFKSNLGDGIEPWGSQQASAAVLDQASAAVLDDGSHGRAFGHGTMVSGMVHWAAPTARIMSIRAFDSDGNGSTSDILRSIYFAANKGAKVINMSFSRPTPSAELKIALDYASARGVILVSSTGNEGTSALRYPAAYNNVIGVASTANDDSRSNFSNYGSQNTVLASPGEWVITPYPGNRFAAASGTSFTAPTVAGMAALIVQLRSSASSSQVVSALSHAKALPYTLGLGYGRADVYQTVLAARALWPTAPYAAVPASCASDEVDWSEAP